MDPKPFTLETILKHRKRQENLAQERLVQAQLAFNRAVETMDEVKRDLTGLILLLEKKQLEGIYAKDLEQFEERILYCREQLVLQKKNVSEKQKILENRRLMLLNRSRDHKALDTLKEKQNLAWRTYLDKKEAAMLDEIAILRHDRKV
jgi:flagellar FliJ protein